MTVGDGFGDPTTSTLACDASGSVLDSTDCDDTRVGVFPDADEICDDIDNDWDGESDEDSVDASPYYADVDADGSGGPQGQKAEVPRTIAA